MLLQAWTKSSPAKLLAAQQTLLHRFVRQPLTGSRVAGLNTVDSGQVSDGVTVVLAHGFGSGLGFFYRNFDALLADKRVGRVVAFDWLGMGGSERPDCRSAPRMPILGQLGCNSRFSQEQATDFFIDPVEQWFKELGLSRVLLFGHSLGGYLAARFALKYPGYAEHLVLASPVGFSARPADTLPRSDIPRNLRIIDSLWSANVTPQQLVRVSGHRRGTQTIRRALAARLPNLVGDDADLLAEYLYHITVAPASGEFAMNSLLQPSITKTSAGVYAREPLEPILGGLEAASLRVVYGDHDWMRPANEASARSTLAGLRRVADASVEVVPGAGHHLYLDNPVDLHRETLRAIQ